MRACLVSGLLILLLLLAPSFAHASIVFQEDWEGTPASIVTSWNGGTSCGGTSWPSTSNPGISTTVAFSGTHSLHAHYQGHQQEHINQGFTTGFLDSTVYGGCTASIFIPGMTDAWFTYYEMQRALAPQTSFFIDEIGTKDVVYIYIGTNAQTRTGGIIPTYYNNGSIPEGGTNGKNRLAINFTNITAAGNPSDNIFPSTTFFIVDNHWVCYEFHIKLNGPGLADGLIDSYATDMTAGTPTVQLISNHNKQYLGSLTTSVLPSDSVIREFKVYVQDGWGDIWQDDHTISTTRVGCSGTPPAGDVTAPAVPSGFGVVTQ